MTWWRTVRFWLAGGKRRWFARKAKRLPAALQGTSTPARAGELVELVSVGLDVDGERALAVVVACDRQLAETVARPELAAAVQALLERAAQLATGPAWRIGWIIGKRLNHPGQLARFGAGLALHQARGGEPDALVMHLDECRALGLLDRALLAEVETAFAAHPKLQDHPSWSLCRSCCYEHLGDLMTALRVCSGAEERRLHLIGRLEQTALDAAAGGDASGAMTTLVELRKILASERDPSAAWLERIGVLERHRTELLVASRAALRADLDRQAPAQRRAALLACAAFEELSGEWAEAALLLEQAGELADRLRASQLWEQDERYGEAVRSLGPLSDRAEVQLRMAHLREAGGDAAGAATLFDHLRRWPDAQRAHEAAGHWIQAAHCYREGHGALAAARSADYARLLGQAQRIDDLLQLYLEQLDIHPRDRAVLDRLRALYRDHDSQIGSPHLREAGARHLADGVDVGVRDAFEQAVDGWIAQARTEIERRFGRIWGMDLGTSKSAVAVFDLEQGAAVICPHHGQPHFPSTLALDKHGNELVGLSALDQLRPDLRGCIEGSKRAMGTRRTYRIGDRHFSPEEVAARLLTHGRGLAESFLRDRVEQRVLTLARARLGDACEAGWLAGRAAKLAFSLPEAVVTIPAYFNFDQRRATRDAAEIAGIKVLRLVPEPTAACLSAGLSRQLPGKLMVVDLGAGTLDLTYLEASYLDKGEGFFEVEQIFGDSQFGSCDFDAVIEKMFVERLQQAGLELRGIDRRRLHASAEQLKIALSSSPTASDELIAFAGQPRYTLELTAARLEQLLEPLLARLEATCRQASGLRMDHLVLVGGPMFSPLVRRRIEKLFARKADAVVDPRTAVAMGAACQGALLSNHAQVPFLLLDIVPFALGVLAKQDKATAERITFHIPRGTRIPHDNARPYSTVDDNQTGVDVQVFQGLGDSTDPAANSRLAVVHLDGIPAAKAGEPKITVLFRIDANGLLEVTAKDEQTGKSRSLRIEDATWLSPSERSDMTRRLTEGQRWARARAELTALAQQVTATADKLQELERRDAAQAWQRQFAAWQRAGHPQQPGVLDPADDLALAGMYNAGQTTCDRAQLGLDRARNLRPRHDRFVQATTTLDFSSASTVDKQGDLEKQLAELQDQGRQLEAQLRDTLATLEPLELQFRQWSAILARASALRADPRERFAIHHDAGDWQSALDTYPQAFAALAAADVPLPVVHRHLDGLARLGRRAAYRQVLADHRDRLALRDLQLDTLNEFGRHVSPAIAWVFASGLGTGSGFLVAPDLVVTNRHVVTEQGPVPVGNLAVQVGGTRRAVTQLRFPPNPEIDLAILQLAEPLDARPVRVGYSGLVEIGERVLAIGFPLPEGDSFDENLLLDHGIVNRIRTRPDRHGRELELGLRISPGMSGGPIFNDRGEVIAVSTFVRYQAASGGPIFDRSSHAIAVDALHELLPRPWTA